MPQQVTNISFVRIVFAVSLVAVIFLGFLLYLPDTKTGTRNKPIVIGAVRLSDVDVQTLAGFAAGLPTLGWSVGKDVILRNPGPAAVIANLDAMGANTV